MATSIAASLGTFRAIYRPLRAAFYSTRPRRRTYREQFERQAIPQTVLEEYRKSFDVDPSVSNASQEEINRARRFKEGHPDFQPILNPAHRDLVSEHLQREDMMNRRKHLEIPEFYVGSILAVTLSTPYAEELQSRFVGICIQRHDSGLKHNFTLRNVIDGMGIEIMYELYNPTVKKIEVLKLEKRLDNELLYLKDCPHEFSTIAEDMEAVPHPKGAPVPVNEMMVKLNPKPWKEKWERFGLKGVHDFEEHLSVRDKTRSQHRDVIKAWEKHDIMMKYRDTVRLEDEDAAYVYFAREQDRLDEKRVDELDRQAQQSRQSRNNTTEET